jgi:Fe-S protein assembly co-chaperone HscB
MPDPFAEFGLEPRFDLDLDELRQKYLAASAAAHPDRVTDPLEQADAAERSARINDAYGMLRDPERRAWALLQVRGGELPAEEEKLPPALLMELMEQREEIDAVLATGDADAVQRHRAAVQTQLQAHLDRLAQLFAADPPDAAAVRRELQLLRYTQRQLEQLER